MARHRVELVAPGQRGTSAWDPVRRQPRRGRKPSPDDLFRCPPLPQVEAARPEVQAALGGDQVGQDGLPGFVSVQPGLLHFLPGPPGGAGIWQEQGDVRLGAWRSGGSLDPVGQTQG